jgi:hypothetical protein
MRYAVAHDLHSALYPAAAAGQTLQCQTASVMQEHDLARNSQNAQHEKPE